MTTGYVWDERYAWHDPGGFAWSAPPGSLLEPYPHLESPESKRRFAHLVEVSGLLVHLERVPPREASDEDLLRVHTPGYVSSIRARSADPHGGDAGDGATRFARGGFEIARLAAGGAIAATEAVLAGRVSNAYALVRPPGHHALPSQGLGFCIFGNVAIAAEWARARHGVERVAVVDWDVHHGNGSQAVYESDPRTLTISVHQDGLFPLGSGPLTSRGTGPGEGYAINVPMPAGCGNAAYAAAIERVAVPALRAFRPDLLMVSSGFDASLHDPLGRQSVTAAGFRELARLVREAAEELCGGRLVLVHEGGYSPFYVPYCGLAVLEELSGVSTGVTDPRGEADAQPAQALQPWQEAAIEEAAGLARALTSP